MLPQLAGGDGIPVRPQLRGVRPRLRRKCPIDKTRRPSRRRWRKLHLGIDADTHEIVAVELTPGDVGDISELPHLLDQIDADVVSMTADGAYDGRVVYDAVTQRHPNIRWSIRAPTRPIGPTMLHAACLASSSAGLSVGRFSRGRPGMWDPTSASERAPSVVPQVIGEAIAVAAEHRVARQHRTAVLVSEQMLTHQDRAARAAFQ
jgi:Transposase DDE domain